MSLTNYIMNLYYQLRETITSYFYCKEPEPEAYYSSDKEPHI